MEGSATRERSVAQWMKQHSPEAQDGSCFPERKPCLSRSRLMWKNIWQKRSHWKPWQTTSESVYPHWPSCFRKTPGPPSINLWPSAGWKRPGLWSCRECLWKPWEKRWAITIIPPFTGLFARPLAYRPGNTGKTGFQIYNHEITAVFWDSGMFFWIHWKRFQYFEQKRKSQVVQGVELFELQKK